MNGIVQGTPPFRVGVVGCGSALSLHLPGIFKDKRIHLRALCDTKARLVREKAEKLNCRAYVEFESMLTENDLDVIHILTPPQAHTEIGVKAARAGCHLLVEKPMADCTAQAQALSDEVAKNGCALSVVHNHLFDLPMLKAIDLLRSQSVGKLLQIQIIYCLNRKETKPHTTKENFWVNKLPIPVFFEWLPHTIYLSQALVGALGIQHVSMREVAERRWISVVFSGEVAAAEVLILDNTEYELFHVNLFTEKALVHMNMIDLTIRTMKKGSLPGTGPYMINSLMEGVLNLKSITGNLRDIALGNLKRKQSHINLIRSFYDFLEGKSDNPVPASEGIAVIKIMDEIKERLSNN